MENKFEIVYLYINTVPLFVAFKLFLTQSFK